MSGSRRAWGWGRPGLGGISAAGHAKPFLAEERKRPRVFINAGVKPAQVPCRGCPETGDTDSGVRTARAPVRVRPRCLRMRPRPACKAFAATSEDSARALRGVRALRGGDEG